MSSVPSIKRTLSELALKVIQGHPYWFRHKSRMLCRRNVQLTPIVSETYEDIATGKRADASISTTLPRFEDAPARNAFDCLEIIYTERNYISAADSMDLCLLLFTQLFLKVKKCWPRADFDIK